MLHSKIRHLCVSGFVLFGLTLALFLARDAFAVSFWGCSGSSLDTGRPCTGQFDVDYDGQPVKTSATGINWSTTQKNQMGSHGSIEMEYTGGCGWGKW